MTFPLDPGARAFQAKAAERAAVPAKVVEPLPPECFQAEDDEHAVVTPPGPADPGASPSS